METDRGMVAASSEEENKAGRYCLMAIEFLFYKVKTILALDLGKIYPL